MADLAPTTIAEVQAIVDGHARVRVRGGGTKTALQVATGDADAVIDLRGLSGIVEYDPGEYTFTARAATPVAEVQRQLARHGQALPFDPPLAERGATLGGTLAAGLSGPGRYRFGGVRDFVLGVRLVDGRARVIVGGGRVVKNAAGFDLPKLVAGSLGRLGVVVEATFKVFPRPEAHGTVRRATRDLAEAVRSVVALARSPWDADALDIVVDRGGNPFLDVRLAGLASALPARLEALRRELGGDVLAPDEDDRAWHDAREFAWLPPGAALVKVPLTPSRIVRADEAWSVDCVARRYSAGGQVAWVAWRGGVATLDARLRALGLAGLVVLGPEPVGTPLVGVLDGGQFAERVTRAMDPHNRFGPEPRPPREST